MISIKIAGKFVDLPPDTRISMTVNNPLFNDDGIILGDYTLPFDLSSPDKSNLNAETFRHPDVLESLDSFRKEDAEIYFDDVLYKKGQIVFSKLADKINTNFKFGLSNVSNDFKTKKIRELINENIVISAAAVAKKIYFKPNGAAVSPYTIKVNDRDYTGATLSDIVDAINADATEPRATATLVGAGVSPGGMAAPFATIVNYYNSNDPHAALSINAEDNNWNVEAQLPGYYDEFNTFFASYLSAAPATDKFRLPIGQNVALDKTTFGSVVFSVTTKSILSNWSNAGVFVPNVPTGNSATFPFQSLSQNNLQPLIMLKYVLQKAAEYFNISYEGDWVDTDFANSRLFYNTAPLGFFQDFIGNSPFLFWRREFNLNELVPDITFIDLLKALQNRYNLSIKFNETTGKLSIKKRKPIVASTSKRDISNKAGIVTSIEDQSLTGLRLEETEDKDDKLYERDYVDIDQPEMSISGLCAGELFATDLRNGLGPFGFIYNAFDQKNFPLRFVVYDGFIGYPKAAIGTNLTTLYNDEWKQFIFQRIHRKAIELPLYWELQDILNFDFDEKVQYDRNDYFIAQLNLELTMTRVNVRALLYKC